VTQPKPYGPYVLIADGEAPLPLDLVVQADGQIDPNQSALGDVALSGTWDSDTGQLEFSPTQSAAVNIVYSGYTVIDPLRRETNYKMGGVVSETHFITPATSRAGGWYAERYPAVAPADGEMSQPPGIAGRWEMINGRIWWLLSLTLDQSGAIVDPSTVNKVPITGSYDIDTGRVAFRATYPDRSWDDFEGYLVRRGVS
jgi:hypothetical protein